MNTNHSLLSRLKCGISLCLAVGLTLGAALIAPPTASAQSLQEGYITKSGTGTTSADAIFPAAANAALRLTAYDVKSDLTSATLKFYVGTKVSTIASNALSTATNVFVTAGATNFSNTDIVVIQHADETMTALVAAAPEGNTNVCFTGQIGVAVTAGAKVYKLGTVYTTQVQSTNVIRVAGESILVTGRRMPLLLRVTGTSACSINSATGKYD